MVALMKFDTLSWSKKLERAGVPLQQAEVQAELVFRAIDDNICTKQDLRELEGNISIELKELELKIEGIRRESLGIKSDLELTIEKLNANISKQIAKWVLGVSAIQATVLLTLIRYMHQFRFY